jgi:hypothetical protein
MAASRVPDLADVLAAILHSPQRFAGRKTAVVCSGGNISPAQPPKPQALDAISRGGSGRCVIYSGSGTPSTAQSHAINGVTSVIIPATMAGMEEVEVVVAHSERATLRVGDVFLKIDADQARADADADAEVEAMALAPIPTPEILWRKPPVLAIAAVGGTALGRLGRDRLVRGVPGRRAL